MRILLFYGWNLHARGGAETSICQLAEALTAAGHSVGLADIRFEDSPRSSPGPPGIPYWSIPALSTPTGFRTCIRFVRTVWQLRSVLREFRPDVVSAQALAMQCHLLAVALTPRHRLVLTARGSDIHSLSDPNYKRWQMRLMNKADAVVAVSTPLLQELLALYPWVRNRATVIPNSIDESWFIRPEHPQPSGERYVLFVGRLHAVKGIDLLLRAWSLLQGQLPGVTLVLAGAGKELEKLRALTEQMGISASVCFKGHQTPAALRGLYWGAEAVVLSSRKEGLPRVCLEAGACGAIRVATAVGGVPELIRDGVTGLLVSPDSAEALAQGILHALRLPDTARKRMSAAARENVREQFSQKQMVARYEAVFQAVS